MKKREYYHNKTTKFKGNKFINMNEQKEFYLVEELAKVIIIE